MSTEGRILGASKVARDITDRKRIEAQISVLSREAEHRAKNLLANVRAMVRLSRGCSPAIGLRAQGRAQTAPEAAGGLGAGIGSTERAASPFLWSAAEWTCSLYRCERHLKPRLPIPSRGKSDSDLPAAANAGRYL
jgi:hypothetical protein